MADVEDHAVGEELRHICDLCSRAFFVDFSENVECRGAYLDTPSADRWKSLASRFGDEADAFLRFCEPLSFRPNWLVHPSNNRYYTYFDVSFSDLQQWARQDCLFSYHLLQCLKVSEAALDETHVLGAKLIRTSSEPHQLSSIHFVVFDLPTWKELRGFGLFKNVTLFKYEIAEEAKGRGTIRDHGGCPTIRRRNRTPSSKVAMERARHWMETCIDTHADCPKPGGFLPTRVLELSSTSTGPHARVKMTMGQDQGLHYAALSYCWGGNQALVLRSDTCDELSTKGIFQADLPQTIADAIVVAVSLGIRRLWVDALCIMQDSDEDKAREIAQVAMVYSNAAVTIAVSRASSVDEGFLSERFPVEHGAVIELAVSEAQTAVLMVPEEPNASELLPLIDRNPLGRRAWTFQERLLSPRVLDYGSVQTRWWCPEVMKSQGTSERAVWTDGCVYPDAGETGKLDGIAQVMEGWRICNAVPFGHVQSSQRHNNGVTLEESCKRWKTIVDHYSERKLTVSSDRLPAISAIARSFQSSFSYRYVAGLWFEMMPSALLWMTKNPDASTKTGDGKFRGPTWSWASVDGAVQLFEDASQYTWWTKVTRRFRCNIVDWEIVPLHKQSDGDEFGALKSAVLTVCGYLTRAYWRLAHRDMLQEPHGGEEIYERVDPRLYIAHRTGVEEDLLCKIRFDTSAPFGGVEHTALDGDLEVFLLVVASISESNKIGYTLPSTIPVEKRWHEGLVLRKLASGEYCRMGTFQSDAETIFSGPGAATDSIQRLQQRWMVEGPTEIMRLV